MVYIKIPLHSTWVTISAWHSSHPPPLTYLASPFTTYPVLCTLGAQICLPEYTMPSSTPGVCTRPIHSFPQAALMWQTPNFFSTSGLSFFKATHVIR